MEGMEPGSQMGTAMGSARAGSAAAPGGEPEQNIEKIDWDKVGKIYKPESAIEDIVAREMGRLQVQMDHVFDKDLDDLE